MANLLAMLDAAIYAFDRDSNAWQNADGGLSRIQLSETPSAYIFQSQSLSNPSIAAMNEALSVESAYQAQTDTFHCFSINPSLLLGINFPSKEIADQFAMTVNACIENLIAVSGADGHPESPFDDHDAVDQAAQQQQQQLEAERQQQQAAAAAERQRQLEAEQQLEAERQQRAAQEAERRAQEAAAAAAAAQAEALRQQQAEAARQLQLQQQEAQRLAQLQREQEEQLHQQQLLLQQQQAHLAQQQQERERVAALERERAAAAATSPVPQLGLPPKMPTPPVPKGSGTGTLSPTGTTGAVVRPVPGAANVASHSTPSTASHTASHTAPTTGPPSSAKLPLAPGLKKSTSGPLSKNPPPSAGAGAGVVSNTNSGASNTAPTGTNAKRPTPGSGNSSGPPPMPAVGGHTSNSTNINNNPGASSNSGPNHVATAAPTTGTTAAPVAQPGRIKLPFGAVDPTSGTKSSTGGIVRGPGTANTGPARGANYSPGPGPLASSAPASSKTGGSSAHVTPADVISPREKQEPTVASPRRHANAPITVPPLTGEITLQRLAEEVRQVKEAQLNIQQQVGSIHDMMRSILSDLAYLKNHDN